MLRWLSIVCLGAILAACGSSDNSANQGACANGSCNACGDCYDLCVCTTGDTEGCVIACNAQAVGGFGNTSSGGTGNASNGGTGNASNGGTGGTIVPTGGMATALTITEVSLYQGVKVPLMQNGGDVGQKNAPPVVDREGRIRVFVSPEAEWQPRDVIAQIELGGSAPTTLQGQGFIQGASTDAQMETTLNVDIPPGVIKQDTTYSVTLLEASDQTYPGSAGGAKYPPSGASSMGAKSVNGVLNLTIVPIVVNGVMPDMSQARIDGYHERFKKLYPVPDVVITVRQAVTYNGSVSGNGSGWNSLLDYLLNLRANDKPPKNAFYYGSFTPTQSFNQFCQSVCVAGLGVQPGANDVNGRGAIGLGFFPSGGNPGAPDTACHEIGHTHGRPHAPCGTSQGLGPYPYSGGIIGDWGYDIVTTNLIDPQKYTDMMGYCQLTWISDFNYNLIFERLAYANSTAYMKVDDPDRAPGTYQSLVVESDGTLHWGSARQIDDPLMGDKKQVTMVDAHGKAKTVTGIWYPVDHLEGGILLVKQHLVSSGVVSLSAAGIGNLTLAP